LLLSRSNAGSARRDRREGSVGPSEGRATDTRGRRGWDAMVAEGGALSPLSPSLLVLGIGVGKDW